jgi:hypothetical protein
LSSSLSDSVSNVRLPACNLQGPDGLAQIIIIRVLVHVELYASLRAELHHSKSGQIGGHGERRDDTFREAEHVFVPIGVASLR